ncbi:MAG TPA: glycosyltransferase family 2 protein [Dehalococcoidia bacterium]|nr:glycosyltransferase family 2 protein [Dehalococcoidia bacterium]
MKRTIHTAQPDCSIIIATHNRLPMLKQALASALVQRDVIIEVLVVENGSTDGTLAYLKELGDPRVIPLIFEEALGATEARNGGLRVAAGRWLAFLDDDDLWAPDKLSAQLKAMAAGGCDWSYTGCVYIDRDGVVMAGIPPLRPEEVAKLLPQRHAIPAGLSSMMWRAGVLDSDGLLDSGLTYMVDWDLSQRLLRKGLPACVPRPLVGYRQHGANMSVRAGTYMSEMAVLDRKFADLRHGRSLDFAFQHRNAGSENLRAGHRRRALACYARALSLGDLGAVLRAAAVLVPMQAWPYLRKQILADEAWMREGKGWLRELSPSGGGRVPAHL